MRASFLIKIIEKLYQCNMPQCGNLIITVDSAACQANYIVLGIF